MQILYTGKGQVYTSFSLKTIGKNKAQKNL